MSSSYPACSKSCLSSVLVNSAQLCSFNYLCYLLCMFCFFLLFLFFCAQKNLVVSMGFVRCNQPETFIMQMSGSIILLKVGLSSIHFDGQNIVCVSTLQVKVLLSISIGEVCTTYQKSFATALTIKKKDKRKVFFHIFKTK